MFYRILILLSILPLAMLGCSSKNKLADKLPLDQERPTLVIFYADL